ncbi:hypothetical protein A33M_0833 [Rhodovulum sp. PH10]|uniref:SLC13 family permease n=1 Tax=Rhodovulum sp. PH10 TaxID=1187851 RepID=UPI00027C274D|nr:SLC13 family permease [Rhodovulum sp. PH10]EJW13007.1 hypothetical protein A33M_0833 [Rhodovulum sp. PH10]
MAFPQIALTTILAAAAAMFLWGRWRHDLVAVGALLACVLVGIVPSAQAFDGFSHPAVVTVAAVLILSRALQESGTVDLLVQRALPKGLGPGASIAALTALGALLSAFMNNVGALALLMPIGVQIADRQKIPPGQMLMPLAFGSILGGMTTLIGTPPNLIVSAFRAQAEGVGFGMFDFSPVGVPVALAGGAFLVLAARILVPARPRAGAESFEIEVYLTEVCIPPDARAAGMTLREIEAELDEADAIVVGMIRREVRLAAFNPRQRVRAGDILVIEADSAALAAALPALGLELVHERAEVKERTGPPAGVASADGSGQKVAAATQDSELALLEMVVLPASPLVGRSVADVQLRTRYAINMLAISRQGQRSRARLRRLPLQAGDVLLMQGLPERLNSFATQLGCVPLAARSIRLPRLRDAVTAAVIMALAVGAAALGLAPAAVAFTAGALAAVVTGLVPARTVYEAIDWSVIVLLGALIPVAGAMATTGTADLVARFLLHEVAQGNAILGLAAVLVLTMTLSDFMNNAATATVMCPVAIGAAQTLGVSVDPFLIAVAVGASCAFLTPIGHQNNTLILGPGGLRFGDYWRLGLPLEIVVVVVAVPLIVLVWPLNG